MSRNKIPVFFLLLLIPSFLIQNSAWAWPFGKKEETKPASRPATSKQAVSKKVVSPGTKTIVHSSENEETFFDEEAPKPVELPSIPKVPKTGGVGAKDLKVPDAAAMLPSVPGTAVKEPGLNDPEILKIQNQIQEIIKINEDLKNNYADQAAQIQKISEQAKIHEKILKDLEETKKFSRPATENYLDLEKVKLIQKETEENRKFLTSIQNQKPGQGQAPAAGAVPNPKNS